LSDRVDVSVIYPCLNERDSIATCVKSALAAFDDSDITCEVVVADNGSTDGSADEAVAAGARVVREERRGYGAAVCAGVDAAHGDVVLVADADGTYPIEDGPAFVRAAQQRDVIVLGSRFAGRIERGAMPFLHRVIGSPATRMLLRLLLGVKSTDPHSGMRAMKRTVFDTVRPAVRGWEFTFAQLVNASRRGVVVAEIPIDYRVRSGESKLRALPEGWKFFRFLVLHSPIFLFVIPGAVSMALGTAILAWLAPADRTVAGVNLGVNSLQVGALLAVAGYQVLCLGICARAYMARLEHGGAVRAPLGGRFTLERGVVIGGAVMLVGVALVAAIGARWIGLDFGLIARGDHGIVIVGLTVALTGTQTIFSSFFLSLLSTDA
jgi:glycosyltransferase involved in cell wall biosynthesis